ncbi:monovalent cation/H(+) antiporter subunit G [candidate division KSB1 bacterium]
MTESIGFVLIIGGLFFNFSGCLGLVRLPDVFNRLQSATKCVTLGTCLILLGTLCYTGLNGIGIKVILCIWFIFMASPTAAHAIAKASHNAGYKLWDGSVCDHYHRDGESGHGREMTAPIEE